MATLKSFNTQPPEGGWAANRKRPFYLNGFNTQPPEGGWLDLGITMPTFKVSTHSRPKAAGL